MRRLILASLVLGFAAAGGWMAFVRRDRVAPPGEELLFDDFGFSVKDVRVQGRTWTVDLQVANHAKRVGYRLDTHQAVIVDEQGRSFAASNPPASGELPHGESRVTPLVFDLPDDARVPRLAIRFGEIGSLLDYVLLGDWSLELRPR